MIETATKYILDLLTKNEELNKFPQEFVNEAVKWVKSWFLKPEDPKTTAKLEDPNKSSEVKKDIIQDKLEDLKDNTQFQKELSERLAAFEQQLKTTKLNVIEGGNFKIQGSAHIGTVGESSGKQVDEENVIKDAKFEVGGDFRLGNTTQIINNYFGSSKTSENVPPQYQSLKSTLKSLLAKEKTAEVIEQLLDYTETHDNEAQNTVLLLSARLTRINSQEHKGIISNNEAGIERNKINAALTSLIDELGV